MYNMNGVRHALYEQSKAGMNFNNLSKLVVSKQNILLAYRNVRGNKGAKTPGTDGLTMAEVDSLSAEEVVENFKELEPSQKNFVLGVMQGFLLAKKPIIPTDSETIQEFSYLAN